MSISVGKYSFKGPYINTINLEDKSGIYAIHCHLGDKYFSIDVGESATVKSRIETHDRKTCWTKNCSATLTYSVLYTPHLQQEGRIKIEKELRNLYDLPCGEL